MFKEREEIVCVRTSPMEHKNAIIMGRVFKGKTYTFSHFIDGGVVVKEVTVSVHKEDSDIKIPFQESRFKKQVKTRKTNSMTRQLVKEYKEIEGLPEIEITLIFN